MRAREGCIEFAKLLRSVGDGSITPGAALERIPDVHDPENVPKTWGSARIQLEAYAEDLSEMGEFYDTDLKRHIESELMKLADRLVEGAPET